MPTYTIDTAVVVREHAINDSNAALNGGRMLEAILPPTQSGQFFPMLSLPSSGKVIKKRKLSLHNALNSGVNAAGVVLTNPEVSFMRFVVNGMYDSTGASVKGNTASPTSEAPIDLRIALTDDASTESSFDFNSASWYSMAHVNVTPVLANLYIDVRFLKASHNIDGATPIIRVGDAFRLFSSVGNYTADLLVCELSKLTDLTARVYYKPRTAWTANAAVALGVVKKAISTANQHAYKCINAGSAGATEPVWNQTGGTTNDGTIVWQDLGVANVLTTTAIYFAPDFNLARICTMHPSKTLTPSVSNILNSSTAGVFSGAITLYNASTRTRSFTITFTSSTAFTVTNSLGESLPGGNTLSVYNCLCPETQANYFSIPIACWSGSFVAGDVIPLDTFAGSQAYWVFGEFDCDAIVAQNYIDDIKCYFQYPGVVTA